MRIEEKNLIIFTYNKKKVFNLKAFEIWEFFLFINFELWKN